MAHHAAIQGVPGSIAGQMPRSLLAVAVCSACARTGAGNDKGNESRGPMRPPPGAPWGGSKGGMGFCQTGAVAGTRAGCRLAAVWSQGAAGDEPGRATRGEVREIWGTKSSRTTRRGMGESALGYTSSQGIPGTFPLPARKKYWCTNLQAEVEGLSCANLCTIGLLMHAPEGRTVMTGNVSSLFQGKLCAPIDRPFLTVHVALQVSCAPFPSSRNCCIFVLCSCASPGNPAREVCCYFFRQYCRYQG